MRLLSAAIVGSVMTAAAAASIVLHSAQHRAMAVPAAQAPGAPATKAVPGLTWRSGSATLHLTGRACPYPDLAERLEAEGWTPALLYVVQRGNLHVTGCWTTDGGGDVITMEPGREGGPGEIPIGWFRGEPRA